MSQPGSPDLEPVRETAEPTGDPDVDAARGLEPGGPGTDPEALTTDELRPEESMIEYDGPDRPSEPTRHRRTGQDEREGSPLETRLAQEEPEEEPDPAGPGGA